MSDFIGRQVQRLLGQAEEALDRLDWREVRTRAVLRLDPDNAHARALIEASSRDGPVDEYGYWA